MYQLLEKRVNMHLYWTICDLQLTEGWECFQLEVDFQVTIPNISLRFLRFNCKRLALVKFRLALVKWRFLNNIIKNVDPGDMEVKTECQPLLRC